MLPLLLIAALLAILWITPQFTDINSKLLTTNDDTKTETNNSHTVNESIEQSNSKENKVYGDSVIISEGDSESQTNDVINSNHIVINSEYDSVNTPLGDSELSDAVQNAVDKQINTAFDNSLNLDSHSRERPASGYIFSSAAKGNFPQLTLTAPQDKDAFIKLRNISTNRTILEFYVRAGDTVEVCAPQGVYNLSYGLGNTWFGLSETFGDDGIYAASDLPIDFSESTTKCTYIIDTVEHNVNPYEISKDQFTK